MASLADCWTPSRNAQLLVSLCQTQVWAAPNTGNAQTLAREVIRAARLVLRGTQLPPLATSRRAQPMGSEAGCSATLLSAKLIVCLSMPMCLCYACRAAMPIRSEASINGLRSMPLTMMVIHEQDQVNCGGSSTPAPQSPSPSPSSPDSPFPQDSPSPSPTPSAPSSGACLCFHWTHAAVHTPV